jgi:hypothetical protein
VGKGEDMSSTKSSCEQGVLKYGEEVEEMSHPYGNSCGAAIRVNEDDGKLKIFIKREKDQGSVLVIGQVNIFLPRS